MKDLGFLQKLSRVERYEWQGGIKAGYALLDKTGEIVWWCWDEYTAQALQFLGQLFVSVEGSFPGIHSDRLLKLFTKVLEVDKHNQFVICKGH